MSRLLWGTVAQMLFAGFSVGGQFFVSPAGSDSNPGTFELPFLTIAKAVSLPSSELLPGDTIIVRGGVYSTTATIAISRSGTDSTRLYLIAYPGERPILDFSSMPVAGANRGINLKGSFWHLRGLDIKGAGDNGMIVSGSGNIIEFCAFYENRDTGLQLAGGAANNEIVNCDAFFNADPGQGNADGFAPKLDVGSGNSFRGCRSWQNSDDGWDGYLRGSNDVTTTLENCWSFANGYLKDGSASTGNGNGFKTGGSDAKDLMHNAVLRRCLAFDNRVKGFDQNNNRGSITLYHATAYRNSTNYSFPDTLAYSKGKVLTIKNCASLGWYGSVNASAVQATNSWLGFTVGDADFLTVDTTGVRGPRRADGSLPDVAFLHLAPGSSLIDAGTDIGMPFNGSRPDLGSFESGGTTGISPKEIRPTAFRLLSCYPNPFNPSTNIPYLLHERGEVLLRIYDISGTLVRVLESGTRGAGAHAAVWDGRDSRGQPSASGVYIVRLDFRNTMQSTRIVLVR